MAYPNNPGSILSPLNTIRDIILAIDTSTVGGARQLYQVPSTYDLWLTKITSVFVCSTSPKIVRIYNKPPGENAALFHSSTNGPAQSLDFHANPVLLPPGTVFSLDTDLLTGQLTYHHTAVWGVLTLANPAYWS